VLLDELLGGVEYGTIDQARIHNGPRQTHAPFLQDKRAHE
jgi:hypothetical protein